MPVLDVDEAKIRLSRMLARMTRLVSRKSTATRRFGAMKGKVELTDAFFKPLPEDELKLWEGGSSRASSLDTHGFSR